MEALLIYFLKMTVFSSLMFGYYFVFLKDKTFHHYNRFYLLSIVIISIFLPFIKIEYFTIEVNPDIYLLLNQFNIIQPQNTTSNDFNVFSLVFPIVALVSFFFILKFISGLLKIQSLKKHYPKTQYEGINFYQTALEDAPFSYFKNLFWKDSISLQSDLGRQILKHEMVHIEQKHTWDKILISTVQSLFWFNPVFYFLKKEIALIHEYLADKKSIEKSDTKAFAQMLLRSHFTGNSFPATSPFLNSNLKKRLTMLKKSHTQYSYARKILALPLVFALGFAFLVNAKNREISKTNVEIAEAVSQIKKDTIKNKYTATAYYQDEESFDEYIKKASDKTPFFIDNKKVNKAEYLKYYYQNKDSKTLSFTVDYKDGTKIPKAFGTIDLNDTENVALGRAYDEKLDGKLIKNEIIVRNYNGAVQKENLISEKYSVTSNYSEDLSNNPILEAAKNAGDGDLFFIHDKKSTKEGYIKYVKENGLNGKLNFSYIRLDKSDKKMFLAYNVDKNEVKTDAKNYSATAAFVKDGIDRQYDEDAAKVIEIQEKLQKRVGKNVVVENVAIARQFPDGSNYKIEVKGDKVTMNPTLSNKYDRIYINGKLSTQSDLDKIDRKKIKSENIKNNNHNGETYNEIKIRTRK